MVSLGEVKSPIFAGNAFTTSGSNLRATILLHSGGRVSCVVVKIGGRRCAWRCILIKHLSACTFIFRIGNAILRGFFNHLVEIFSPFADSDMGSWQGGTQVFRNPPECRIEPNPNVAECRNLCGQQRNQKVPATRIVELPNFVLKIRNRSRCRQLAIIQAAGKEEKSFVRIKTNGARLNLLREIEHLVPHATPQEGLFELPSRGFWLNRRPFSAAGLSATHSEVQTLARRIGIARVSKRNAEARRKIDDRGGAISVQVTRAAV